MKYSGAIDFRKLLREERQRVREESWKQKALETLPSVNNNSSSSGLMHPIIRTNTPPTNLQREKDTKNEVETTENNKKVQYTSPTESFQEEEKEHDAMNNSINNISSWKDLSVLALDSDNMNHSQDSFLIRTSLYAQMNFERSTASTESNFVCDDDLLLQNIHYQESFLTQEYVGALLNWLQGLPHYQSHRPSPYRKSPNSQHPHASEQYYNHHGKWTRLHHAQRNVALFDIGRSSLSHGFHDRDDLTSSSSVSFPFLLDQICHVLIHQLHIFSTAFPPNHILINEYQPHEGILPHTDGPSYFPTTATISIGGGDVLLKFTRKKIGNQVCENMKPTLEIKLSGNGSLIVFRNEAYTHYYHSIEDRIMNGVETASSDGSFFPYFNTDTVIQRGYRMSLTFRHKYTT